MSLDINLTNVESTTNKSTNVNTDQASNTKYPSVKAVFDWANSAISWIATNGSNILSHLTNTSNPHSTTATQVDALKRDGSNANSDVDLGTYSLNAKSVKVNGTAGAGHVGLKHQSSGATATGSESVLYADSSGNPKWKNDGNAVQNVMLENSAITGATKTKITYDSKGLVTAGADATTADIADSTNKRYVTDAQLTVIGNTSGTNTGDETQNSILSKLGWFTYNRVAESTAVTGTTAETIIENITILANTFVNGGIIRSYNNKLRKVGGSGTLAIRLYIGPTANNLTGATLVGSFTGIIASQNYAEMLRTFTATTSGILGFSATQSGAVDTTNSSAGRLSASIDWTVEQNFMITVQLGSGSDSVSLMGASLKNF